MTNIDLKRLEEDREYWNSVAPSQCDTVGVAYIGGKYWSHEFLVNTTAMAAPCGAEVKFILRPPKKAQGVEWQDGLPPVGTECEYQLKHDEPHGEWSRCVIEFVGDHHVVAKCWPDEAMPELEQCFTKWEVKFRPLKPKQNSLKEDLARIIEESDNMAYSFRPDDIADAILSLYNLEKK